MDAAARSSIMRGEAPVTPRTRRLRMRKQRVHLPEKAQSTPVHDWLRSTSAHDLQLGRLPGGTSVELQVARALVSNRPVGEPIALPLSAAELAAQAAESGVMLDDAVSVERREKWLADPAVRRRVDAYLNFVEVKATDLTFSGVAPQHVSLSLNLAWLRLRTLEPLLIRDKAAATRGAAWWEPGMGARQVSGGGGGGGGGPGAGSPTDEAAVKDDIARPPGVSKPGDAPPFCADCSIVPAELRFRKESTSVLAVALCRHCMNLREEERLVQVSVEKKRLVLKVGFDPLEAQEQAEKKNPARTDPGDPIEQAPPPPDNPKAAAAARLAKEREAVKEQERAAEAARTAAAEVCSVEAINLGNNDLRSCEGLANSIRPFLFYSRCECLLLLDLSHNNLTDLGGAFDSFPNLQMLYLSNNMLDSMGKVAPLSALKRLEKLTLGGNPMQLAPPRRGEAPKKRHDYRTRIIAMIPWLKQLDATTVTADEGATARKHTRGSLGGELSMASVGGSGLKSLSESSLGGDGRGGGRRSVSPTKRMFGRYEH